MASHYGGLGARRLMVRDWYARRGYRMQRLGRYLTDQRLKDGASLKDVVDAGKELGERLNKSKVSEIEQLRDDGPGDVHMPRNDVSFMAVWFLVAFYSNSRTPLADLERYILTGELASAGGDGERANLVTQAFLALPESERQQAEHYLDFLYQQAMARTLDADTPAPPPPAPAHDAGQPPLSPRGRRAPNSRPATANEMARLATAGRGAVYAQPPNDDES